MDKKINNVIEKQRNFYNSGKTRDIKFRLDNLKKLRSAIKENESELAKTLYKDLGKSYFESYATEIGLVYEELNIHIKRLKKWAKPKRVATPIVHFPSVSYEYPEPYGIVLIIAPWNYPFNLLVTPLIGAISAGNCIALKPANYSKNTTNIIEKIIKKNFPAEYISIFKGGREVNADLLEEKFDYIFFTGSPALGKIVMQKASRNLTPVTLELGGKSPCIIDEDADIDIASRRITWGKLLNAGQTCIAPDYMFVHKNVKKNFIEKLKKNIVRFFGENAIESPDYSRIINEKHFDRLIGLVKKAKIAYGCKMDRKRRYISPTIIDDVKPDDPVMKEEIFGPFFPIMEFDDIDRVIDFINSGPKPLAFYYFTKDKNRQKYLMSRTSSGGMCINDTMTHVANPFLGFGGIGNSGMGSYHGKKTFDTFTHYRPILKKSLWLDIPVRYPPYNGKLRLLKMLLK